ncbi:MAG TPA: SAM-dependent methyltransferase [Alphaproteobacteria bacterium]|nr:SAM-dependent methyltransferase [Alphaproteobacteria bacterium]
MDDILTGPFDRRMRRLRRDRAADKFVAQDFLVKAATRSITERLSEINRDFDTALDLGGHIGGFRDAAVEQIPGKIGQLYQCDQSPRMVAQMANPYRLVADEEALPFAAASFDLIVSALSLHMVNDLPGTLLQIRHCLKPDGLFIGAMFGGETLTELRQAFARAEIEQEGGMSPRVAPFTDIRDAGSLLQRAGFTMPVTDFETLTVTYPSLFRLMQELRDMGESNSLTHRHKHFSRRQTLLRAAEIYHDQFSEPDQRIRARFDIIYLTGWSPSPDQPKPLRPGSARMRLADALGTSETVLPARMPDDTPPDE